MQTNTRSKSNSSKRATRLCQLGGILSMTVLLLCQPGCKSKETPKPEPAPEAPVSIHLELQVYRLPRSLAVAEVFGQPKNTDYSTVLKRVQTLAAEKKATLVSTLATTTRSGQRASAESVFEQIYPTEFNPPQIPTSIGGPTVKKTTTTTTETTETTTTSAGSGNTTNIPMTPSTPTAFTMRPCGLRVEWEPVYFGVTDKNKLDFIEVTLSFDLVDLLRTVKFPADGGSEIEQPIFYTKKLTTAVTVKNGSTILLGTVDPDKSVSKDEDFTEVIFVRASAW